MYNDLEVGSYLTWEGWPRFSVFQDPRINGYPDDFHAILRRADLTRAEWQALLDRFGVTSALISFPDLNPRAALFDPERWALVYRAADGLVFARRREEWAQLIENLELPVTFAPAAEGGVAPRPLLTRPAASTVPDCVWSWRLADLYVELGDDAAARPRYAKALREQETGCAGIEQRRLIGIALGDLALRAGDSAAAVEAYADVHDPAVRVRRGLALLKLRRDDEALADFREARDDRPDDPDAQLGEALALAALDRPEARGALERFLSLHPGHLGAASARAALGRVRQR
jgi:tetratricopeptide (TPR) repeat protein